MVRFIDAHRTTFGVEPICSVRPIAPSRYYELKARGRDPHRRPARARRDEWLSEHIPRVWLNRPESLTQTSQASVPQLLGVMTARVRAA